MALVLRNSVLTKKILDSVKYQHVTTANRNSMPATPMCTKQRCLVIQQRIKPLMSWLDQVKMLVPVAVRAQNNCRATRLPRSSSSPNLKKTTYETDDLLPRSRSATGFLKNQKHTAIQETFFDCCTIGKTPCLNSRVRFYVTDAVKAKNVSNEKNSATAPISTNLFQARAKSETKNASPTAASKAAPTATVNTAPPAAVKAAPTVEFNALTAEFKPAAFDVSSACCGCCGCGCGPCGCGCGPCCGCCGCGPCGCGCGCGPCGCGCCGPCGCGCGPCGCGCGPCGCGCCGCGCGPCGCGCGPCGCGCCGCGPCGCGPCSCCGPCGTSFYVPTPITPAGPCGPCARGPCP